MYLCIIIIDNYFQINGQSITWQHIHDLVDKVSSTAVASHGLSLIPKLKQEHVKLTSYSRMRVDLAAQVCIFMCAITECILSHCICVGFKQVCG